MIEDSRYCVNITPRIKVVRSGLKQIGPSVLEAHLHPCVTESIRSKECEQIEAKIRREMALLRRWGK